MKLYPDYKKLFKLTRALGSNQSLKLWLVVIILLIPVVFSHAQTASDLRNKISQKDSEIAKLEEEIKAFQNQLDNIGEQKNSLSNSIKELDLTKKKLTADIAVTQNKIDKTNFTIESLSSDIGNKQDIITNHTDSIELGIERTNELENNGILETLLSASDFTVVWNDIDNMTSVREKIRQDIAQLKEAKTELEGTREKTITAKNELTKLQSQLSDQKKIVIQNTDEKNKLLQQTKNNEANYQKLLKDRIAQRDAFEKEIQDYEAQLQFILDPSTLPKGRVLSWPLDKIFVTNPFGRNTSGLYASGLHNGVDFRASVGTPIMAMADGAVLGVGDTDLTCSGASFGKFVFIEYNNGLSSTYGHLSLIKVSVGEKIQRGEVIGYSGNTGHSTGPHLHVSLYAPKAAKMTSMASVACSGHTYNLPVAPINGYLNVLDYLPPYTLNTSISKTTE